MKSLKKNEIKEMSREELMKVNGGGSFGDGVYGGCSGNVDQSRYGKDFWYTVGWGIGKTLKDQVY